MTVAKGDQRRPDRGLKDRAAHMGQRLPPTIVYSKDHVGAHQQQMQGTQTKRRQKAINIRARLADIP